MAFKYPGIKLIRLGLAALAAAGAGCATTPSAHRFAISELPNCFESNYDAQERLFTIRDLNDLWADPTKNPANQQCLLTVGPRTGAASTSTLTVGRYVVYVANGGGGGAGGTLQSSIQGVGGGGGGGGGAGSMETKTTAYLTEGAYKLTIGAGGPGGRVCEPTSNLAGGTGWLGSPSNIVNVATGVVLAGVPGADEYVHPSIHQLEKLASKGRPGQGGFGPGQTSGGAGARPESASAYSEPAKAGASTDKPVQPDVAAAARAIHGYAGRPDGEGKASSAGVAAKVRTEAQNHADLQPAPASNGRGGAVAAKSEPVRTTGMQEGVGPSGFASDGAGIGGTPGFAYEGGNHPSGGGGGGATHESAGGSGGGENVLHRDQPPVRGSLGSGGGGGEGSRTGCDAGARGGHGYIAFRRS